MALQHLLKRNVPELPVWSVYRFTSTTRKASDKCIARLSKQWFDEVDETQLTLRVCLLHTLFLF